MANPLFPAGTLNRTLVALQFINFPQLNVNASFLGKRGINISPQGDATQYFDVMTGAVTSPEPYVRVSIEIHLLKSQGVASLYKAQWEITTLLGPCMAFADSTTLTPFTFVNCALMGPRPFSFSGEDPDFPVMVGGVYQLNNALWS